MTENIDRLIEENKRLKAWHLQRDEIMKTAIKMQNEINSSVETLIKERYSLKAENEKLQEFYDTHVGTILEKDFCREYDKHDLILERDKLKAEIERLQDNRAAWKKEAGNWYESNQRMKDRIGKLREALMWIRNEYGQEIDCSPIAIRSTEALAEDDKHES